MGKEFRFYTKRGPIRGYAPDNYDGRFSVIYIHGYGDTVDSAWEKHHLLQQFKDSGLGALFLVVEAPANGEQPVFYPDLPAVLYDVKVGAGIEPPKNVVAIGHSGAYRTLARWLDYDHLKQVIILDGLFGYSTSFQKYVAGGGKLTILATDRTATASSALASKVKIEYIKTPESHMGLVTTGKYIPELLRRSVAANAATGIFLWAATAALFFMFVR